MLNIVRRIFTRGTTPTIRCEIYKSLFRQSMEYGSIVRDPHQYTRIKTLKAVQNKGARYANQDRDRHKCVTTTKKDLGWLTLQERRLVNRRTFIMKSTHDIHICWRLICHYIVRDYILVHQLANICFIHSDCCIVCCHLPDTRKPCIENRSV